ncbi:hypothetical protein QZH41_014213, partial [Actinostola sp. cb2023]
SVFVCMFQILDAAKLCKCGHVNEAMRTIAGKRFSGYREELITRRVIKESRDEYRRMKRESRGIKTRTRKPLENRLQLRRNRRQLVSGTPPDGHQTGFVDATLTPGLRGKTLLTSPNPSSGHHGNDNDMKNTKPAYNPTTVNTNTNTECTTEYHVTRDVMMNKRRKNPHVSGRHTAEDYRTSTTKPLEELAMAGPLAEINKRLVNQSVFWMCLADTLSSFGNDAEITKLI